MRHGLAPLFVAACLTAGVARACPMCRDSAVIAPAQQQAATVDFNGGIYALFGVGAVVVAAAGRAMVRAARG